MCRAFPNDRALIDAGHLHGKLFICSAIKKGMEDKSRYLSSEGSSKLTQHLNLKFLKCTSIILIILGIAGIILQFLLNK